VATATFTTVEARVDQTLTNAIWADEIKDNLNQLAGAHRNLLTNGGFEVWQRGAGGFTTLNAFTADRWQLSIGGGSTSTVTQETTTKDSGSISSLKAVIALVGTATIFQTIENPTTYRGKTVSASIRIQQGTASSVDVQLNDGVGATQSATSATTGSFVTFTVTRTIDAAATQLALFIRALASSTFYLDNAMLVIGPAPAPYQPLHPQEELARCQRYYEVLGGATDSLFYQGYNAAAASVASTVFFKTTKGGTPTATKNGTWAVVNCGQPTVGGATYGTCYIAAVVTALGNASYGANSTDDTISVEYNP